MSGSGRETAASSGAGRRGAAGAGATGPPSFTPALPPAAPDPRARPRPGRLLLPACRGHAADSAPAAAPAPRSAAMADTDEHSYAEPGKVVIDDLALDLKLDFDGRTLAGTATYTLQWKDDSATQLVLDTRDLAIEKA